MRFFILALLGTSQLQAGVSKISGARIHTCAINDEKKLFCWGKNDEGQLGLGHSKTVNSVTQVNGQYSLIATSRQHTCLLDTESGLRCAGGNRYGQLGMGTTKANVGTEPSEIVVNLPTIKLGGTANIRRVALSSGHSCAVFSDDRMKCWGKNLNGELGQGTAAPSIGKLPSEMGESLGWVNLGDSQKVEEAVLGNGFTCALLKNGDVKCWGKAGFLGNGKKDDLGKNPNDMGNALPALDFSEKALKLAAADNTTCALLASGKIKCWGSNTNGILGIGEPENVLIGDDPGEMGTKLREVPLGGLRSIDLACGFAHCCAILENHALKCWGRNLEGQLGLGDTIDRGTTLSQMGSALPFVNLGPFADFRSLALGSTHTCAVLQDLNLRCWGFNAFGQLGNKDLMSAGASPETMGESLPVVGGL